MPKWSVVPTWTGQDVYVIGGGPTLKTFDWSLLHEKNTVGCNSAFKLGARACKVVVFGDYRWWDEVGWRDELSTKRGEEELRVRHLQEYGGLVVSCADRPIPQAPPWLLWLERYGPPGLSDEPTKLGFNNNTGSLAINLALLLGAKRVFLLGFDMRLGPDKSVNWHKLRYELGSADSYPRFMRQFPAVVRDLPLKFPGREVWNVTDDSALTLFPRISLAEHFGPKGNHKGENK